MLPGDWQQSVLPDMAEPVSPAQGWQRHQLVVTVRLHSSLLVLALCGASTQAWQTAHQKATDFSSSSFLSPPPGASVGTTSIVSTPDLTGLSLTASSPAKIL